MEEKKVGVSTKIADFLIRWRVPLLIILGILTLIFGYGLMHLKIKVRLDEMQPPLHPFVKLNRKFMRIFGGANTVVIEVHVKEGDIFNYKTLSKIKRITDEIQFNKYVRRALVASITRRKAKAVRGYAGGVLDIKSLAYPEVPKTPEGIERLKKNIFTNEFYRGILVSNDGKAALIFADLKETGVDYKDFFKFLLKICKREEDNNTIIHMAGFPVLMGWIYQYLPAMNKVFLWTIIIVVVLVVAIFRNFLGSIVPMIVGFVSTVWGLGFIGLIGMTLDPLMLVLPFLVGARALSHSVQTTRRWLEEYEKTGSKLDASYNTIRGLFLASLSAIITDAGGFLVLVLARIPCVQKLALLCTFWVIAIFIIVAIGGPLMGVYLPAPRKIHLGGAGFIEKILSKVVNITINRKGAVTIMVIFGLTGLIGAYYTDKITVGDIHPGSPILFPDSKYNRDVAEINSRFDNAGVDTMNVVVAGIPNCTEMPSVLYKMEYFTDAMKRGVPAVGGTQCLVNIVKKLNQEFHEGDPKWYVIPDSILATGTYILMYRSTGEPGDFDVWSDYKFQMGSIRIYFKNHLAKTIKLALKVARKFLREYPELLQRKFYDNVYKRLIEKYPDIGKQHFVVRLTKNICEFKLVDFLEYMKTKKASLIKDPKFIKEFPELYSKKNLVKKYPKILKMSMREFVDTYPQAIPEMKLMDKDEFMTPERYGAARFLLCGGTIGVLAAVNEEIEWSQAGTILLVFVIVFILCSTVFRSVWAGVTLAIPLIIANLAAFTYMVIKEISLDVDTLPVFAVGIGVGVDYGIYVISRFREEYENFKDIDKAVQKGISTAGLGVVFTAITLTIPVLLWYFLSEIKFQADMGLLLAFLLIFNMLGALLFIPAVCSYFKPRFITLGHE